MYFGESIMNVDQKNIALISQSEKLKETLYILVSYKDKELVI